MIGVDTSFLVAFEIASHPLNEAARTRAEQYRAEGFALAPQVVAEFAHVVTDPRRFEHPLSMDEATSRAQRWWRARESVHAIPSPAAVDQFLQWINEYRLGRLRILDTLLAATYATAGVSLVLTTNARDFAIFPGVHPILLG